MNMHPIAREDVEKALDQIEQKGMPRNRRSTIYCLVASDHHYPPKHALRLAHQLRYGTELPGAHGGEPTNGPLRELGFAVEECMQIPHCQAWIKD